MPIPEQRLTQLEQRAENPYADLSNAELLEVLERLAALGAGSIAPAPTDPAWVSPGASPALRRVTDQQVIERLRAAQAELEARRPPPLPPRAVPIVVPEPEPVVEPHPVPLDPPPLPESPPPLTPAERRAELYRRDRDRPAPANWTPPPVTFGSGAGDELREALS